MTEPSDQTTTFSVVAGNPTATELAAVTAVLTTMASEAGGRRMSALPLARSAWSHSQRAVRHELVPGPGAWNRQQL